jgi:hypothetical protein
MGFFDRSKSIDLNEQFPVHSEDLDLISHKDVKWGKSFTMKKLQKIDDQDNTARFALLNHFKSEGMNDEDAALKVRKRSFYFYGKIEDREDQFGLTGDDSRLPFILKSTANRLMIWKIRKMDKAERESVSSMNALVRELIRSGVS